MTDLTIEEYMLRFFQITAKYDDTDFWWRTDGSYAPVTILVNCNDFFGPGADAERIPRTQEALDALEQAYADCAAVKEPIHGRPDLFTTQAIYGSLLWAARHRNEGPWARKFPECLKHLFGALPKGFGG